MTQIDSQFAVVFPGQGSQSLGMMRDLHAAYGAVRETFVEASDALGYDLWQLIQDGPVETLNATDRTQPAMLASGVAVWRQWQASGGKIPALLAGHSLGEYSALVAAGAIGFADAIRLVADRGRFMQEAVPPGTGAMAAILGLDDAIVQQVCDQAGEGQVVSPVNFNSPGQIVIAGHAAAVERAMAKAKEAGAKRALPLPVSVPSHCALMRPAAARLAERLRAITVTEPRIDVVNNVDVACPRAVDDIRSALAKQLYSPVRWVETVKFIAAREVKRVVEFGPGKVLVGLNKRIVDGISCEAVYDVASFEATLSQQ